MIDLNRLAGFHLVASCGGYARAARAAPYPITQPALHQQVRKLEAEVGVELLERVGKDVMRPTAAGERLLRFAAPFLRDLPAVVRSLRSGDFDGTLSIHAESLLIRQLLPPWLATLRRRRPGVQLELRELLDADVQLLRSGRADVLVAHLPEIPDDIAAERVATVHACLVVPKDRAPRGGRRPQLKDLGDLPFLSYPAGSRQAVLQQKALAAHGALPRQSIALDSADVIHGFVESGLGWSLVPSLDPDGPKGRRLAAYEWREPQASFPVVMAWRKDTPENPMLDALLACAPAAR